ncbi:MAG: hypothetical protein Q9222_006673 [Ikaeria aurantiellina]
MSALSVTAVIICLVPNILWTGSLTPIVVDSTITGRNSLKIAQYSTYSKGFWSDNGKLWHEECNVVNNEKGSFSDCAAATAQSNLMSRAASATSDLTRSRLRNDKSHYSYVGRSYGVGFSAGLVDSSIHEARSGSELLFYNYTEAGYLTHTTCLHNESMDYTLEEVSKGKPGNGIPYSYYAIGHFPNASPDTTDFFAVVGMNGPDSVAVMSAKQHNGHNVILVTTGANYLVLNGTQCTINFSPAVFDIDVDVTNGLIYVSPNSTSAFAPSLAPFDPTGGIAKTVLNQLNALGQISPTLFASVFGDALVTNLNNTFHNVNASSNDAWSVPETSITIADSFSAMIDEILLFVGSSQLFLPNAGAGDFSTVDVQLTVKAVRIGETKYVVAIFATCVTLLVAVMAEAFRTKFWDWLPQWDFADMTCLILSSAVGGNDIILDMSRSIAGQQLEWLGSGGHGWGERRMHEDPQGRIPPIRLRLGLKAVRMAPAYESSKGQPDRKRARGKQLSAVSLWTSSATGVIPLR